MIQVRSKPPAEPVWRVMSEATMKMPEPIIDPTTIMVPSKRPMARTKPRSEAGLDCANGAAGLLGLRGARGGGAVVAIGGGPKARGPGVARPVRRASACGADGRFCA